MKVKQLTPAIMFASAFLISNQAHAVNFGPAKITAYHLNSLIEGRGPCVRTNPPATSNSGWICIYKNQALYTEIRDFLSRAWENRRTCNFSWTILDRDGHARLELVECGPS